MCVLFKISLAALKVICGAKWTSNYFYLMHFPKSSKSELISLCQPQNGFPANGSWLLCLEHFILEDGNDAGDDDATGACLEASIVTVLLGPELYF
jgi:hypothetical protein